ncbi:hypothetical protein [Bifidobacterium psychraerophilum]|uniref:hypothetical protein n=1 Tax=Bifidobacterium psychraerophilum TaxID=218140 RepID=UPI0039E849FB
MVSASFICCGTAIPAALLSKTHQYSHRPHGIAAAPVGAWHEKTPAVVMTVGVWYVPLCLSYSNKETITRVCQHVAKLFENFPSAPQVIPPVPIPTRRKRYWTAEEDEYIRQQHEAGLMIAEISRQLASNWWAIKKRVERLE